MKRILSLVALLTLGALNLTLAPRVDAQVLPAPTFMNFQGRLARPDGTPVADGDYSISFSLWDAVTVGNQKWTQTLPTVAVANGVFDVLLDVGTAGLFNGDLWLEIQIGTDVPLSPRQQLVSAAYAMKANSVPDGSIAAAQIANGSVGAAQIALSSISADKLVPGALNSVAWLLSGNSGTSPLTRFLGTTDNQPLVFRANNVEQMRIGAGGQVGIGTASPLAKLHVSGGSLRLDSGQELFFTDLGQIRSADNNHRILFRRTENKLELREYGDLIFSPGAISGSETAQVVMRANGNVGIGVPNPAALLHVNGGVKINGVNTLEFGADVVGKEANAGKIGYQVFTAGSLDIVGAGPLAATRKIKFWAEGGAEFAGRINAPVASIPSLLGNVVVSGLITAKNGGQFQGALSAPSATIPTLNGNVTVGGNVTANGAQFAATINAPSATIPTLNGNVSVNGEMTAKVVTITGGSDVAEPYHVANAGDIKPIAGMVVAIDSEQIGQMRIAARAYDKTVAGILSGANGISPGITLRQAGTVADGTLPVASIGRVWCYCDADANGSIEAGDMLTTSDTPGHAMKVDDFDRANGSVIGKAMSPLKSGQGLVLVFVSLK